MTGDLSERKPYTPRDSKDWGEAILLTGLLANESGESFKNVYFTLATFPAEEVS